MKNNCLDCGKELKSYSSKRCRSCSKKVPFEQRFWSKVNKDGSTMLHMTTPCWEWIGRKLKNKYGYFDILIETNKSISVYAHRISWELFNNQPIPKGLYVLHRCDNPSCVNPEHLFLGTYKDNSDDMIRKGRAKHVSGENHGCAKFTQQEADNIRTRYALGGITPKELAKAYLVNTVTIHNILRYKTYSK